MAFIKKFVKPFAVSASKDIMRDTIMDDAVAGGLISCTYPLDASQAEITAFSPGTLQFALTNGSQTGKFTLVGAPGAQRRAVAAPTNTGAGTGIKVDNTVGKKVIEWIVILPASVGGGAAVEAYHTVYFLASTSLIPKIEVDLRINADGTSATDVRLDSVSVFTGTVIPSRVAMILNATAGTVEIRFDDVPLTLSANTYTPALHIAGMWAYEQTGCPSGDAGKEIGGTLVTDRAAITGTYTAGETDMCGTLI